MQIKLSSDSLLELDESYVCDGQDTYNKGLSSACVGSMSDRTFYLVHAC